MSHKALVMTRVALILGVAFSFWELGAYPRGLFMGSLSAIRGEPKLIVQGRPSSLARHLSSVYRDRFRLSVRRHGCCVSGGSHAWYTSGHRAATRFFIRQQYGQDAFELAEKEAELRRAKQRRRWEEEAAARRDG